MSFYISLKTLQNWLFASFILSTPLFTQLLFARFSSWVLGFVQTFCTYTHSRARHASYRLSILKLKSRKAKVNVKVTAKKRQQLARRNNLISVSVRFSQLASPVFAFSVSQSEVAIQVNSISPQFWALNAYTFSVLLFLPLVSL